MSKLIDAIDGAPSRKKDLSRLVAFVIHHAGPGTERWTRETFVKHRIQSAKDWQKDEKAKRRPGTLYAYSGYGYNVIVFPDGSAFYDVPLDEVTWSTGGLNSSTIALCFAGNYMGQLPTEAALKTAEQILVAWKRQYGPRLPIIGHRDGVRYSKDATRTSCPGDRLYAYLPTLSRRVEGYLR